MKKTLFLGVMVFLIIISLVSADELQGFIEQPTVISTACIRNGQMRTNVSVVVTIFDEQGVVVVGPVNSTNGGNGTFQYSYIFNQAGKYSTKETCDFGDYLADGSTAISIIKPMFGTMQVMAQSVAETGINKTAKAEWLLLLPNSTGAANSTIIVNAGVCSVLDLNDTLLTPEMNTVITSDRLTTSFRTDPAYGFEENENYQIMCDINLTGGLSVKGIKNYLYVNPHMTYLQYIGTIFSQVGQILGIVQETQTSVNQTLSISNQTLQIVSNLNITGTSEDVNLSGLYSNMSVLYNNLSTINDNVMTNINLSSQILNGIQKNNYVCDGNDYYCDWTDLNGICYASNDCSFSTCTYINGIGLGKFYTYENYTVEKPNGYVCRNNTIKYRGAMRSDPNMGIPYDFNDSIQIFNPSTLSWNNFYTVKFKTTTPLGYIFDSGEMNVPCNYLDSNNIVQFRAPNNRISSGGTRYTGFCESSLNVTLTIMNEILDLWRNAQVEAQGQQSTNLNEYVYNGWSVANGEITNLACNVPGTVTYGANDATLLWYANGTNYLKGQTVPVACNLTYSPFGSEGNDLTRTYTQYVKIIGGVKAWAAK